MLFPTSLVGSYPQPDWLIDRARLADRLPPRVRARELWRVDPAYLEQAQDDATVLAIRAQEQAGQRSRAEYRLTEKGLDLYPVLIALMEWGDRHEVGAEGPQVLLRHRDCDEPVRLQLACEAGHVIGSAREVTPVPGPGARKIA